MLSTKQTNAHFSSL
uniref:Uncharacterized protein n=1 Tax=Anguilla anguilla TaxID=7936 RepID=A0A0E9W630_ANGAN